jgi:cytochrome P450
MAIFLLCIVVLIGFAIAHYGAQDSKIRQMCRQLPGPKGWPLIGNGLLFFGRSTEFIGKVKRLIDEYGTPFHLKIGHKHYVLVDSPEDMQIVMNSPNAIDKDEVYRFMILPDSSASLVMSNGEHWKHHRKLLNPAFNPAILQSYVPIFNRCGRTVVESVERAVNAGQVFDIEESLHTCSLNMIVGE